MTESNTFKLESLGLEVEVGRYAQQANGSAFIRVGNNIVLAVACATEEEKDFMGFFPLTVEYRERLTAAGKIPGGYIKREGRLSESETLNSRVIDRSVRPFFPQFYFNEVQLMTNVLSADGNFPVEVLSLIGASVALTVSDIPFNGPIGAVKASLIDGQWKFNLSAKEHADADSAVIIAGTKAGICMVEGYCNDAPEAELVDLLFQAHELIKEQVIWQENMAKTLGVIKSQPESAVNWVSLQERVAAVMPKDLNKRLFNVSKTVFAQTLKEIKKTVLAEFAPDLLAGQVTKSVLNFLFDIALKGVLPQSIIENQSRFDGRGFDNVRPISSQVGLLPCVHGSSTFRRGETEALASVTLGTGQDVQRIETLNFGNTERSFMLHYNFPPYSVGEVYPVRGVGRREIGHGHLAAISFHNVLPDPKTFPYTIRSLVDVLECNGSSSMATICSTTLSLMDAGVPIKQMVSGVAMGLIKGKGDTFEVLTDILGSEDAFGLMDFKIAGTRNGVMAFQMDIKDKTGLSRQVFEKAFEKARNARIHILNEMSKTLDKPREEVSQTAPQLLTISIPVEKIGAIIGPSGKVIKEIIAQTGCEIDIEENGDVKIYGKDKTSANKAAQWVKTIAGDLEVGSMYDGIVRRHVEFGLFVELVPGCDGLVHVSAINKSKQANIEKIAPQGSILKVRVAAVDKAAGRIRLTAPDLE